MLVGGWSLVFLGFGFYCLLFCCGRGWCEVSYLGAWVRVFWVVCGLVIWVWCLCAGLFVCAFGFVGLDFVCCFLVGLILWILRCCVLG